MTWLQITISVQINNKKKVVEIIQWLFIINLWTLKVVKRKIYAGKY